MHLRPPSIDHGIVSALWGIGLGLYLFLGMLSVGVTTATSLIVSALVAAAIFFFVRLRGEEQLRR